MPFAEFWALTDGHHFIRLFGKKEQAMAAAEKWLRDYFARDLHDLADEVENEIKAMLAVLEIGARVEIGYERDTEIRMLMLKKVTPEIDPAEMH